MLAGALIRHSFVARHKALVQGKRVPWEYAAVGTLMHRRPGGVAGAGAAAAAAAAPAAGDAWPQVQAVVDQRCVLCHNAQVQQKNVALHTPELIKQHAQNVYQQAVVLKLMPMNNATQITDDERDADQALVRGRRAAELMPTGHHGRPFEENSMTTVTTVHPVDERLPAGRA